MFEENAVGPILYVEEEKKKWPIIGTIAFAAFTLLVLASNGGHNLGQFLLLAIAVWSVFILYQLYRFSCKRIINFGTKGYVLYRTRLKKTSTKVVPYSQVPAPSVNIIANRFFGNNLSYKFEVNYGTIRFNYIIGWLKKQDGFDYQCSHLLYRCRCLYLTGIEHDYTEDEWILQSGLD